MATETLPLFGTCFAQKPFEPTKFKEFSELYL